MLRAVADAPLDPARVLEGIDAAAAAGLDPVKVNMVVRRGLNDGEVPAMAERFRGSGRRCCASSSTWTSAPRTAGAASEVVPAAEILEPHRRRAGRSSRSPPTRPGEVASRYRYLDGGGEIGVIHAVTAPFCHGCTRARLSADGKLFTCLFAAEGHDLRAALRAGRGRRASSRDRSAGAWSGAATATRPNGRPRARTDGRRGRGSRCPTSAGRPLATGAIPQKQGGFDRPVTA